MKRHHKYHHRVPRWVRGYDHPTTIFIFPEHIKPGQAYQPTLHADDLGAARMLLLEKNGVEPAVCEAVHSASGEVFSLVSVPDGPVLAVVSQTAAADALIDFNDVSGWANQQKWRIVPERTAPHA